MNVENQSHIVVFLGPSMPLQEARSVLHANYMPPARQGDLYSAARESRPRIIALVDGEFSQALSVWHKEILYALEMGTQVYGAASMGALRAVETERFGMVGVGEIFALYRDGLLRGDDEVALQFAPASDGYRNLSMPLVNIRATLEQSYREGRIGRKEFNIGVDVAKSLYFRDRVVPAIRRSMLETGIGESSCNMICDSLEHHYVDLKRADTRDLLTRLAGITEGGIVSRNWKLSESVQFRTMVNLDRKSRRNGIEISQGQIARYAALHDAAFNEHNFNARNRVLALALAEFLKVHADVADIEAESQRFRFRKNLQDDEVFQSWLERNDICEADFRNLMEEIATCRRLHRWLSANDADASNTKALLDELRIRGRYPALAGQAASLAELVDSSPPDTEENDKNATLTDLIAEHLHRTDWALETGCEEWAEEAGFRSVAQMARELRRARSARRRAVQLARKLSKEIFSTRMDAGASPDAESGVRLGSREDREN